MLTYSVRVENPHADKAHFRVIATSCAQAERKALRLARQQHRRDEKKHGHMTGYRHYFARSIELEGGIDA